MKNWIIFIIVVILTVAVSFFEKSSAQMVLLLLLFLSSGSLMKRNLLFTGIAIVIISFLFVVKENFDFSSSAPKIRKFNFSIGDDGK